MRLSEVKKKAADLVDRLAADHDSKEIWLVAKACWCLCEIAQAQHIVLCDIAHERYSDDPTAANEHDPLIKALEKPRQLGIMIEDSV